MVRNSWRSFTTSWSNLRTSLKEKGYAHVNSLGHHRYHSMEHRTNRIPNPRPPTDVNTYIGDFKADIMTEVERYIVMEEDVMGLKDKCRQFAWKSRWAHSGQDGQFTLAIKPAYTRWLRCSGEFQYKKAITDLLQQLLEKEGAAFCEVLLCPAILPLPVTSWHMIANIKDWDEVALFENHAQASCRTMRMSVTGRNQAVVEPCIFAWW